MFDFNINPILEEYGLEKLSEEIIKALQEELGENTTVVQNTIVSKKPIEGIEEIVTQAAIAQNRINKFELHGIPMLSGLKNRISKYEFIVSVNITGIAICFYLGCKHNLAGKYVNPDDIDTIIDKLQINSTDTTKGDSVFNSIVDGIDAIVEKLDDIEMIDYLSIYVHRYKQLNQDVEDIDIIKNITSDFTKYGVNIITMKLLVDVVNDIDIFNYKEFVTDKDLELADRLLKIFDLILMK